MVLSRYHRWGSQPSFSVGRPCYLGWHAMFRSLTRECVYNCRHPLWGGAGVCTTADDDHPSVDERCSCDPGYATRDSMGYPSCVLRSGIVAIYVMLAVLSAASAAFLLRNAAQHRRLSARARASKRAVLRLRLTLSARCISHAYIVAPRHNQERRPNSNRKSLIFVLAGEVAEQCLSVFRWY